MTTENTTRDYAVNALTGLNVEVVAGPIIKDTTMKPLTKEGAITILERFDSLGLKVERV